VSKQACRPSFRADPTGTACAGKSVDERRLSQRYERRAACG
jgi:hypothetical protein